MANPEHVSLVRNPQEWNDWRAKHPVLKPDLGKASLIGAKLWKADLNYADLSGADLKRAHLSYANLALADFLHADLREANFHEADLGVANLNVADLREAKLREANLKWAKLLQANLSGADFTQADLTFAGLQETNFGATNLRDAKGLAECTFLGPCFLDIRTMQLSGMLPSPFLRGCGLPDSLIQYLPSLLNEAIQFFSCFISHSTKDADFAKRLYADLQDRGVRCWDKCHFISHTAPLLIAAPANC